MTELLKGALNVSEFPQELVTVNVPEDGGFVKFTVPDKSYWLDPLHAVGFAEMEVMLHGGLQDEGALYV